MKHLTRRQFLSLAGKGCGALAVGHYMHPSLLMAQSAPGGSGKNIVVINLLGGLDGLAAFPYYTGNQVGIINSELRPSLAINPASVIEIDPQAGIATKVGAHPAWAPLVNVAGSKMKVVQGYGIPGDPGRSHDTCQILMSLGASQLQGGEMVGFLARLMDQQSWDTMQYWSLARTNAPDTNTQKNPPVLVDNLDGLTYPQLWWENEQEASFGAELQRLLLEVRNPGSSLGQSYQGEQRVMHDIVSVVRSEVISQIVGNNAAGNYSEDWGIGSNLRDAARILKAKTTSSDFGYQNRDALLLLAQDGYDTHSDQANPNSTDLGIAARIGELATNLAVFWRDLESFGALDNTVIVLYSEFGRTNYQNAAEGASAVGTDHGHASTTVVLGGPVEAGIIGDAPTANELREEWYNALQPKIDYRDIFSDCFEWLGVDPSGIFEDSSYSRKRLGVI